jgi:hypothetical protein
MDFTEIDKLIPAELLRVENKTREKGSAKPDMNTKKIGSMSNFFITINYNVSERTLDTEEKLREIARRYLMLGEEIKGRFLAGDLLRPRGKLSPEWRAPAMKRFTTKLEKGSSKGFIHMHIIVSFEGMTHIQIEALKDFIATSKNKAGERCPYVSVKYFQDVQATMEAYLGKPSNSEPPQPQTQTQPQTQPQQQPQQQPQRPPPPHIIADDFPLAMIGK